MCCGIPGKCISGTLPLQIKTVRGLQSPQTQTREGCVGYKIHNGVLEKNR